MEKKIRKKRRRRLLLIGIAGIWALSHFRKKNKRRYTVSEKHEYYKFLG